MSTKGLSVSQERYAKFMTVWAVIGHLALVLQTTKIYSSKNVAGVSLWTYFVYGFSSILWLIYGFWAKRDRDWVIVISACIAFTLAVIIIIGILTWGDATKWRFY